jgi:hypothetical protein
MPRRGRGRPLGAKNRKKTSNAGLLGLVRTLRSNKGTRQYLSDEESVSEGSDPQTVVMLSPTKHGQKLRVIEIAKPSLSLTPSNIGIDSSSSSRSNDSDEAAIKDNSEIEEGKRKKCQLIANTMSTTLQDLLRMLPDDSEPPSAVSSMFCA